MEMETIYRYDEITIAAGEIRRVSVQGRFLTVLDNSSATKVKVGINGQSLEFIPAGVSVELPPGENFTYLEFQNTSLASMSIAYAISSGIIHDSRFVASAILNVNSTSNNLTSPAALAVTTAAPGAAAIAADPTRRAVIMQNNGANPVWVGHSTVDGSNNIGLMVLPGETLTLESEADIYLRSLGGNSTVSYLLLKKV